MELLECLLPFSNRRLQSRCLGLRFHAEALNFGCGNGLRLGMKRLYLGNAFLQSSYLTGGMIQGSILCAQLLLVFRQLVLEVEELGMETFAGLPELCFTLC